jgi:V/A-type H+-transporting ATPase subunit I
MIARMSKVEIVGERTMLADVLAVLQDLGFFQIEAAEEERPVQEKEEPPAADRIDQKTVFERLFLEDLRGKIEQLLSRFPSIPVRESYLSPRAAVSTVAYAVEHHLQACRTLHLRREALLQQRREFGRYIGFLSTLEGLSREAHVPPDVDVIGLTLKDQAALERVRSALASLTEGQYKLFTVPAEDGTLSGLITVERRMSDAVSSALSTEKVPEMTFPPSFAGLTLPGKIDFLERRTGELEQDIAEIDRQVETMCRRWAPIYRGVLAWITGRLSLLRAAASIFQTRLCFFIRGWLPSRDVERLRERMAHDLGPKIVVEEKEVAQKDLEQVPSVLQNRPYFKPFELFTRMLPLPHYTSYDPTTFIGIFFPIFFGMILGDAGYGLVLALVGLFLSRRYRTNATVRDAAKILMISSLYTIIFGALYGEFFGDLPHRLFGIKPLLIERSTAIVPMFVFALSVGTVHVLFGLVLGAVTSFRRHTLREGAYKVLSIVIILGVVAVIAASFGVLPALAARPVMLTILFLLPLLVLTGGLLAPLELLKSIGNIISYIRITAIGMTSVLLAYVANELAGLTGDIASGILVAALLHALNIVLGVFSPTIHALRLHFVEFFGKFVESGGRTFTPLAKK